MSRREVFLVERFLAGAQPAAVERLAAGLGAASAQLRAEGRPVFWLGSLAVADDETCLCVFAAGQAADVEAVNRLAGAGYERIVAGIAVEPGFDAGKGRRDRRVRHR